MDQNGIMLSEINQRKPNTIWFQLFEESKKQNKPANKTKCKQTHRCREQPGGYQRGGARELCKIGEGDLKAQTSSYKINKAQRCNVQHREYS